jgi:hypothetical protein
VPETDAVNRRDFSVLQRLRTISLLFAVIALGACSSKELEPYYSKAMPLTVVTRNLAGVSDERTRFREIFCQVLAARGNELPDYRACDLALTRVGVEPSGNGSSVALGQSETRLVAFFVPGIGWDCFADWIEPPGSVIEHVRRFGYDFEALSVDSLSSSSGNARMIRDQILAKTTQQAGRKAVLIGYSKGTTDILEALSEFPEIRSRVTAVVSVAGAVGGSPLANDVDESILSPLRNWPGARCSMGDGGAIQSLKPQTRKSWLAENRLPKGISYYSLVSLPGPDNISTALKPGYENLSKIDARNDGQVLAYDQIIPDSKLLGYLNADHWALAVPIARSHPGLAHVLVDRNAYPREALLEAIFRFVEEDLKKK